MCCGSPTFSIERSLSWTPAGKPSNQLAVPGTTRHASSRSFPDSCAHPAPTSVAAATNAAIHRAYRLCAPRLAFHMNPSPCCIRAGATSVPGRTENRPENSRPVPARCPSSLPSRTGVANGGTLERVKSESDVPMSLLRPITLAVAVVLTACSPSPEPAKTAKAPAADGTAAAAAHGEGIAWRKGDVDAAFVQAKADRKPLFLYWGAVWCPPCNQVKATLFNRQDFIDRSSHFIPVYIDGDSPGAQKLGERFKVVGYPTMILFSPDGHEILRLPGEADPEQYMRLLTLGMNGARPVKETLAAALSGGGRHASLSPDDWRMLAYYSWVTDEQQLIPEKEVAPTLKRLAQACPANEKDTGARLHLKALAAAATAKDAKPSANADSIARLSAVLADPRLIRENFDTLTEYADKIAAFVTEPKSPERARLVIAWSAALDRIVADPSLSTTDRLTAVGAKVALARLDVKDAALPPALEKTVRDEVARADRETSDPYARQAVIDAAADALVQAGLLDDAEKL